MVPVLKSLVVDVPEEEVLNSISPTAAKEFGILPVHIKYLEHSQPILDVIGLKGVEKISESFMYYPVWT